MTLNIISQVPFNRRIYAELYKRLLNANLHNTKIFSPLTQYEVSQIHIPTKLLSEPLSETEQKDYLKEQSKQLRAFLQDDVMDLRLIPSVIFDENECYGLRYITPYKKAIKDTQPSFFHGALIFAELKSGQTLLIIYKQYEKTGLKPYLTTQRILKPVHYFINRLEVTETVQDCPIDTIVEGDSYLRFAELVNLNKTNMLDIDVGDRIIASAFERYVASREQLKQENIDLYQDSRTPLYRFLVSQSMRPSLYHSLTQKLTQQQSIEQIDTEIADVEEQIQQEQSLCTLDIQAYRRRKSLEFNYKMKTEHQLLQDKEEQERRYQESLAACEQFINTLHHPLDRKRCRELILFDDGKTITSFSEINRIAESNAFIRDKQLRIEILRRKKCKLLQK
ncbi:hypothetical protein [Gallibacterium salpingitidis]|uniref:Uncharacterized protein n=1 Tax=Gallibacterium salpingitidis TaxID=505341 RepID=A0A1A7P1U4_9PAST|nr:hypothetical protein [Gallibacterium salpingitidis]OBW95204.1 hypothetical protein QS62_04245 [Gallibacterium salpingitidis]